MAGFGESRVPHDILSDEDKWFKFFTKVQLLGIAIFCVIGFFIYKALAFMGAGIVGIVIALIIVAIGAVLVLVRMPNSRYLMGGGLFLWEIILLKLNRRIQQCVYVRNYDDIDDKYGKY